MTSTTANHGAQPARIPAGEQCVLCWCRLETPLAIERGLCGSCSSRPEAKTLPRDGTGKALPRPRAIASTSPASGNVRPVFGVAAKSLIKAMHAYIAPTELLRVLNDRLVADVGPGAVRFRLEDLQAEIGRIGEPVVAGDWSALRQVLAAARAGGVLAKITAQTIEDFAVVFQVSAAQKLQLVDVMQHAKEDR